MNGLTSILAQTEPTWQEQQLDLPSLLAELAADDQRVASCRRVLELGRERIHACYLKGTTASSLIRLQTRLTDLIVDHLGRHTFDTEALEHIAIVAVGGYGRGELHPYSDIDLTILIESEVNDSHLEQVSRFVTELWDTGLTIGHSVRTLQETTAQAAQDITVVTNLMEARHLMGNTSLFRQLQEAISPEHMWTPEAFFEAKMQEQAERREKFHDNAYRLEPNLKESNGGLRDIQTIFWISRRVFGTREPRDLVSRAQLTNTELDTLVTGLEFLCKLRYLLHHTAQRAEDRLLFDYQRDIAREFGFTDPGRNEAIEQLMQMYFRKVTELQRLNDITLQGIGGIVSGVTAVTRPIVINERFQVRNGFLEVTHPEVFNEHPPSLLEIFIIFSNTPEATTLRSNTIRLILSSLHLIDDNFRKNPLAHQLFLDIFRNPNKLTRCIRMMANYGVMSAYLPAFGAISGRMQYDLFHIYTVDEHTTRVIRNLRRFALSEFDDELPLCSAIMQEIEKPELLYLMGLFHDIAKGRGGDHSELGAVDALKFCERHGLDAVDTGLVSWVVMNHLIMSLTAQRKDISDPNVIAQFARRVSSMKHLNHLYLLTVADIRATNPELWNSFKHNLLMTLYESTARMLRRGLEKPLDSREIMLQKKAWAVSMLKQASETEAHSLWQRFDESYFQHYEPHEIAIHADAIIQHQDKNTPLVLLFDNSHRGSTEVSVYLPDQPRLFAIATTAMVQLNLNILSATIGATTDGYALHTYHVLEESGDTVSELERARQINGQLEKVLADSNQVPPLPMQRKSRHFQLFNRPAQIEFDNSVSPNLTSVYIKATDHPGILSLIARGFLDAGVVIHTAKILTMGERIEDVFMISNQDGSQLAETDEQQELRETLLRYLPGNDPQEPE